VLNREISESPSRLRNEVGLSLLLMVVTFCLYLPAILYHFVNFDDEQYVYENPWVNEGLSGASIRWAFSTMHASNWHPLSWISHMIDSSLYGLNAGGHHLTNILLHTVNALLLFLLLNRMTHRLWLSWLVAALFAWHPLHVESVAWVAERKDVLSTLFLILTIWAYTRYTERPGAQRYLLALCLFGIGLLCKPMLVTLPCLLLLLDFWPLRRLEDFKLPQGVVGRTKLLPLVIEKLPFFAFSLAASFVTIIAQRSGGAIKDFAHVSFSSRLLNAAAAYGWYLAKTILPINLSVFYPLPKDIHYVAVISSILVIGAMSYWAILRRRKQPWLLVGWFWFLGMLVPVIGLVQVGGQAVADRYTYVPLVGLFIMFAWGLADALEEIPSARPWGIGAASVALLLCIGTTRSQLAYWKDGMTLFTRVLAVTGNSAFAQNSLGVALSNSGRGGEAILHYEEALRLQPDSIHAHYNLGIEYADMGNLKQAAHHFSEALKLSPRNESLHNNLGVILAQEGEVPMAMEQFKAAIECNPTYPKSYLNYAMALEKEGQIALAITNYKLALERDTNAPEALNNLARLYVTTPDAQMHRTAVQLAERANKLTRFQVASYVETLAAAYAAVGSYSKAVTNAAWAHKLAEVRGTKKEADKIKAELESYKAHQGLQTTNQMR
jgi:protein O-mannosyl-transferase